MGNSCDTTIKHPSSKGPATKGSATKGPATKGPGTKGPAAKGPEEKVRMQKVRIPFFQKGGATTINNLSKNNVNPSEETQP